MTLRDLVFRVRHGFRGFPVLIGDDKFRVDESLRRWDFDGEQEVRKSLIQNLNPGDTAIDIGANFGMHSLIMSKRVAPHGRILAFEPIPENLRLLRRNIALNDLNEIVTVVPTAISDLDQDQLEMTFDMMGLDPAACLSVATDAGQMVIRVKNTSLDRACADLSPVGKCLIKIDVEGAELSVLRSGIEFIRRIKPKLLIEVHTYALPTFGASVKDVHEFLDQNGYDITQLTDMENANGQYHHILAVSRH